MCRLMLKIKYPIFVCIYHFYKLIVYEQILQIKKYIGLYVFQLAWIWFFLFTFFVHHHSY